MASGKNKDFAWELRTNLKNLTKPRIDFIALFIQSILKVGTVNLVKIAIGMNTSVQVQSNYRRIQRFIKEVNWCYAQLIPLLLKWGGINGPLTLVIDRTNWKLGKANINILCIAALGDGLCIPLIWMLLPKQGNSSQEERIELINQLLSIANIPKIRVVIGDREFIGSKWFKYLKSNNINVLIRLRNNQYVKRYRKHVMVCQAIQGNKRKGKQCNGQRYWLDDVQVYLHGFRYRGQDKKIDLLIVASFSNDFKMSDEYAKRWQIESMFKNFKSNGFNLEETHVIDFKRLESLFGLLAIAYTTVIKTGKLIQEKMPQLFEIASNGRSKLSIFRAGLNSLMYELFQNVNQSGFIIFGSS